MRCRRSLGDSCGPIASALLSVGFGAVARLAGDEFERISALARWLSSINLMLALFNLVPGFPLDGGRIFRMLLWRVTGNLAIATRIAAGTGQTAGYAFMLVGIWTMFTVSWFNGLWLVFIGRFLLSAAQKSVLQMSLRSALSGLRAEDIMARDCPTESGRMSLAELVQEHILHFPYSRMAGTLFGAGGEEPGLMIIESEWDAPC